MRFFCKFSKINPLLLAFYINTMYLCSVFLHNR